MLTNDTINVAITMLRDYMTVLAHEEKPPVEQVITELEAAQQPQPAPGVPMPKEVREAVKRLIVLGTAHHSLTEIEYRQYEQAVDDTAAWLTAQHGDDATQQ